MLKLVWKDFLILRKVLWYAPLYSCGMAVAFSNSASAVALSASTIGISYMLMIQACARDERNKSEIMLNSLPLRRRDIVLAKYLSIFPYAILGILAYLFTQGVVYVTGIPINIGSLSLEGVIGVLVAMMGMISIYFPVYFKLGYLRSNIVTTVLFLGFFFLIIALIGHGLQGINNPVAKNVLGGAANWLQTQGDWQIGSSLIALVLIVMAASFSLSLRFYSKREF